MRVTGSEAVQQQAPQARTASTAKAKGGFAAALAKASATTTTTATTPAGSTTNTTNTTVAETTTTSKPKYKNAPKTEQYADVKGKSSYDEIVKGPRNGMYVNTSGNERHGKAFVLVKRDGRDVHIYGTGENRQAVVVWHDKDKHAAAKKS